MTARIGRSARRQVEKLLGIFFSSSSSFVIFPLVLYIFEKNEVADKDLNIDKNNTALWQPCCKDSTKITDDLLTALGKTLTEINNPCSA